MTGLPLDAWRAAAQRVLNDGVQDAIPLREWPAALDFLADVGTPHNFIDLMDALTAEREKVVVLQAKYDALERRANGWCSRHDDHCHERADEWKAKHDALVEAADKVYYARGGAELAVALDNLAALLPEEPEVR